jgi:hypothetical protein
VNDFDFALVPQCVTNDETWKSIRHRCHLPEPDGDNYSKEPRAAIAPPEIVVGQFDAVAAKSHLYVKLRHYPYQIAFDKPHHDF